MISLPTQTRQLSRALRILSFLFIAGLLAGFLFALSAPADLARSRADALGLEVLEIGATARGLLMVQYAIGLVVMVYTLWHMARLFGLYAGNQPLGLPAADTIRRAGQGLLVMAILGTLGYTTEGLILSLDQPPGGRVLIVQFGTKEIGFLLAGGLMLMVGIVTSQALAIAQENEGFV